jgi:hypothetical protein
MDNPRLSSVASAWEVTSCSLKFAVTLSFSRNLPFT